MTPAAIYNMTVGTGTVLVGVGAAAAFGWPYGLMSAGGLMVALAVAMLRVR